jgi:hypothetical protein
MADSVDRLVLEAFTAAMAKIVGKDIQAALKAEGMAAKIGFALVMFDFGAEGNIAYASNADREDFLRALDELRGKLAATLASDQQARPQ